MDKLQKADFLINVVVPLLSGIGIYYVARHFAINKFTRNQLPDALWAWSLFSCILIIWVRRINALWISVAFVFCITFEVFQHYQIISGAGDYLDILVYVMSATIALSVNNFFFILFKYNYDNQH